MYGPLDDSKHWAVSGEVCVKYWIANCYSSAILLFYHRTTDRFCNILWDSYKAVFVTLSRCVVAHAKTAEVKNCGIPLACVIQCPK